VMRLVNATGETWYKVGNIEAMLLEMEY
jgi:hypothetical protein